MPSAGHLGDVPIARMSPATGTAFFFAGLATLALVVGRSNRTRRTRLRHWAGCLGSLAFVLSFVSCLAYLYGTPLEIVEEVGSLLRVRANEKNLGLDTTCAHPLPETIRTDPLRLRQVLVNLVGNAIKFTERGGVKVHVRLADQQMHFEITDTGIGMSAEETGRLFRPFTQADMSHSRRFGGTGLGLHISQRLAKLLGGKIEVASVPEVGSTFTLTIDPGPLEGGPLEDGPLEDGPLEAGRTLQYTSSIRYRRHDRRIKALGKNRNDPHNRGARGHFSLHRPASAVLPRR